MRFEVKLGDEIIGFSELEGGDPPMGVASGRFWPTAAYAAIQAPCIRHRDSWLALPELTVRLPGGAPIECAGGVQIIDFSPELGAPGIEIHLNGVINPPYADLFPRHVEAYNIRFNKSG
jgi:hypothetical protein